MGLFAVATLALTAFIGVGSASATETTLCKTATVSPYCASEDRYPSETALEASAGEVKIVTDLAIVKCGEATISGETEAQAGDPLPVDISAWTLGTAGTAGRCGTNSAMTNCTVTPNNLPYDGSLAWTSGGSGALSLGNGGSGQPGWLVNCPLLMHCNFTLEPTLSVQGGSPAQLVASKTSLGNSGGLYCPSKATLEAVTYTVDSPAPAFVAKAEAPPSGTHLCKAAESPCVQANRYPDGTLIEADAPSFTIKMPPGDVTCKGASVTLETQAESAEQLPVDLLAFPLQECGFASQNANCTVTTTIPDPSGTIAWVEGSSSVNGQLNHMVEKWSFNCAGGNFICDFSYGLAGNVLKGGAPARIEINGMPLVTEGPCPITAHLYADFTVTSPDPLYVVYN